MKKIIIGLAVVLAAYGVFQLLVVMGWDSSYSEGSRTGQVYKFSEKGLIYKSWEGEMYLGGVSSDGNGNLQVDTFYFSIPSSESAQKAGLIAAIQDCAENRLKEDCTI